MPSYKAPVEDVLFLLNDVFDYGRYSNLPRFSDASIDVVEAILNEGGKFAEEVLLPLNRVGDLEGCTRADDGTVTTPKGFKEAYKAYVEGGWVGISGEPEYGGQGLPLYLGVIAQRVLALRQSRLRDVSGPHQWRDRGDPDACLAMTAEGQISAQDDVRRVDGHDEPDRAALRHGSRHAEDHARCRNGDGSYAISGQKIFISAGEHDLADNIVHLVLARIEGAPAGVKGISLFLVPKIPRQRGRLARRRATALGCGAIEHKMGIHGNSTCVMNYDGAKGWLVGEENRGLNAMFVMMNAARLGVAVQGLAQSEVAYQNAAAYAKERLQGRSLTGAKAPEKAADPLIVHPDIRRMLLEIRAFNEAARALLLSVALTEDEAHGSPDAEDAPGRRRSARPADAGAEGRVHRHSVSPMRSRRSRCSAATATSPNGAWSNSCAMRASR